MLLRNFMHARLMDQAGGDGGAGGSGAGGAGDGGGGAIESLPLTVAKLEDVPEAVRGLYAPDKELFKLKVTGLDDAAELRRALQRTTDKNKEIQKQLDALSAAQRAKDDQARAAAEEAARKAGDVDSVNKSWQTKYDTDLNAARTELQSKLDRAMGHVQRYVVDGTAMKIASEIAVDGEAVEALLPHVRARLRMEEHDDGPSAIVLGKDGKASALTLTDLTRELMTDKALARLVKGTKASGGAASGGRGGSAGADAKTITRSEYERLSPQEKARIAMDRKTQIVDDAA